MDSATEHSVLTIVKFQKAAAIAKPARFLDCAEKTVKRLFITEKALTFLSVMYYTATSLVCERLLSLFLIELVFSDFEKGLMKDMILIDLQKALDNVDHEQF